MTFRKVVFTVAVLAAVSVTAFAQPDMTINVGADAIVFREEGGAQIWTVDAEGVWYPAITLSPDEVQAYDDGAPDVNTVVATEGDISLEILSSGQWQVSSGPDAEGKVNVTVFDRDFTYAHQYDWSVYGDAL